MSAASARVGYAPTHSVPTRFALTVRRPFRPLEVVRIYDTWDEANVARVTMNAVGRNSGATRPAWGVQAHKPMGV